MWQESAEKVVELRSGLTTGSCATACCVGAARALFANEFADNIEITLPRGKCVELPIIAYTALSELSDQRKGMRVETIKDAGDDPDATHGATVFVELTLRETPGVVFKAASGVGTVTKTGLLLAVGEPAINPVPRKMMTEHLQNYATTYQYAGGFEVAVGVVNGEQIALKTMNGRLGIIGGLSILGTTGIVRPYSCAAYIASIRQGVDVASSNGIKHIAASTGSSSEAAIKQHYQLEDSALIEMGDFIGALLKHLKKGQVQKLSICGGFGKLTKMAQGELDLNSRKCSIDFAFLSDCISRLLKAQGREDQSLLTKVSAANTSIEVLNLANTENLALAALICQLAQEKAAKIVASNIIVEVFAINRQGDIVASSTPDLQV
ncbi:MAG: cobalt-precorrin-5B (C(1))-methyltransferase [Oceanospirillaceae bacterium]|nr:cobalt-precorrin-5B (C(1))-methyltransferase [Oceanospirillaceae bacterium]